LKSCQALYLHKIKETQLKGLVPAISNERFSGFPLSGGYDSTSTARRLRDIFGEAKILIVIREQIEAIHSNYLQYIKDGGCCTLEQFLTSPRHLRARTPVFSSSFFCYERLASYYRDIFGKENVLLLPYEMLVTEPFKYIQDIASHINTTIDDIKLKSLPVSKKENQRISLSFPLLVRNAHRHFGSNLTHSPTINFPLLSELVMAIERRIARTRIFSSSTRFNRDRLLIKLAVGDTFKSSNQKLSEMCRLDLGKWGYSI